MVYSSSKNERGQPSKLANWGRYYHRYNGWKAETLDAGSHCGILGASEKMLLLRLKRGRQKAKTTDIIRSGPLVRALYCSGRAERYLKGDGEEVTKLKTFFVGSTMTRKGKEAKQANRIMCLFCVRLNVGRAFCLHPNPTKEVDLRRRREKAKTREISSTMIKACVQST